MEVTTAWVKPTYVAGGLDHLGVQAPCINIYGRLLPGITNVTDRARYYSFYTWFVWAFDQLDGVSYEKDFKRLIRRADCLFYLVAERHRTMTDGDERLHSIGCIGRDTLRREVAKVADGGILSLSDFATLDDGEPNRYFKNHLGGLGQYYFGTLSDLGLLGGTSSAGVRYTRERGEPLAKAFDEEVDRQLFFSTLEDDLVDAEVLDQLAGFCPCNLSKTTAEREALMSLFFDQKHEFEADGDARRNSLALILDLARLYAEAGRSSFTTADVLHCCYSAALPKRVDWGVNQNLATQRARWAVYQRNELLSVAVQGVFAIALDCLSMSDEAFTSSTGFGIWMVSSEEVNEALSRWESTEFLSALEEETAQLPDLADWGNPDHEIQIAKRIVHPGPDETTSIRLQDSLRLLLALAARDEQWEKPYGGLLFHQGYFIDYPINLRTFRSRLNNKWVDSTMVQVVYDLVTDWGVDAHLSVALRKLRRNSIDTFKVRPTDRGLEVEKIPAPVNTQPRLGTALQIVRDLGLLVRSTDGSLVGLSNTAYEILDECNAE